MVLVALKCRIVGAEALLQFIIVVIHRASFPSMTLNAKVVVALHAQLAPPGTTFENALRQSDARRNVIPLHLTHGNTTILVYIVLILLIPSHLCSGCKHSQKHRHGHYESFHRNKITIFPKKSQKK